MGAALAEFRGGPWDGQVKYVSLSDDGGLQPFIEVPGTKVRDVRYYHVLGRSVPVPALIGVKRITYRLHSLATIDICGDSVPLMYAGNGPVALYTYED
jgi:hypothetical protein